MLTDIFVSEVRVNILKLMLPHPEKALHVRAIVRAVDTEINAVRRELQRLESIGLFRKRQSSNKIFYSVDTDCLYYDELLSLVVKETGLGADIIKHRKQLGSIKFASISQKFARNIKSTQLDVDLFIVGAANLSELETIIEENQKRLGHEIYYSVMGEDEFLYRKRRNDPFITRLLAQGRTLLIGDSLDFGAV